MRVFYMDKDCVVPHPRHDWAHHDENCTVYWFRFRIKNVTSISKHSVTFTHFIYFLWILLFSLTFCIVNIFKPSASYRILFVLLVYWRTYLVHDHENKWKIHRMVFRRKKKHPLPWRETRRAGRRIGTRVCFDGYRMSFNVEKHLKSLKTVSSYVYFFFK